MSVEAAAAEDRWWLDDVLDAVPIGAASWSYRQRDVLVDVLVELGSQGADVEGAVRRVLARRTPADSVAESEPTSTGV